MLETIGKYMSNLRETGLQPVFNVYRGQSNDEWKLRSSATRHLSDTRFDSNLLPIDFVSYHKDILIKAKTEGFGVVHGQDSSDLQLLAELQHFGAPTGLLDFTWNPLVAMWFASQDDSENGKLFSINTNNPGYVYRLLEDEANQDISNIFSQQFNTRPSVSFWVPTLSGEAKNRILIQNSVFVIGPPEFTKDDDIVSEITIKKEDKEKMRSELHNLNINEQSLYRDIFGFAQTRGAVLKFTEQSIKYDHSDDSKFKQGITYFQQRDFHSAVSIFDLLIRSDSSKAEYYLYSGIANVHLEYYIEAVHNFDKYISLEDQNHLAYYCRSIAKFKLRDFEGAIEDCNSAIRIKPNNVTAYFNRSASKVLLNQYKDVISDSKEAISLEPFFVKPYSNLAYARYKLGQYDKAIKDYSIVLKYDPESFEAYHSRACAYYELEKYEYAVQDFTHAIGLNPNYAEAYYSRACAYYELEKYEYAVQDLTHAIGLNPNYAEAYYSRACAYYELEKYEYAVQDFTHAIGLNSVFAEAFFGRAHSNKELGRNQKYEKDLKIAYRLKPQLAD